MRTSVVLRMDDNLVEHLVHPIIVRSILPLERPPPLETTAHAALAAAAAAHAPAAAAAARSSEGEEEQNWALASGARHL